MYPALRTALVSRLRVQPLPELTTAGSAFAATRLSFPTGLNGTATGTNRFQLSNTRFGTPAWNATGWRFAFPNLYLAGTVGPERSPNSARTIEFATVTDDATGTNAWPVTFNGGQVSAVVAPGEILLSDPVAGFAPAANGMAFIRVQTSVPVGGNHLVGAYLQTQGSDLGEGNEGTSTVQTGKRLGGAITQANPGSTQSYTPCFAVAKGWDGASAVFLINGTSRQVPTSDNVLKVATRGVVGATQRGLDSPTGGRMAFGTFSQSGAYAQHTASEAVGAFGARMAALRAIGNAPFNRIITDVGPNDINLGLLSPEDAMAATRAWWAFWRALCPAAPVYHLFGEPWTTAAGVTYWTTVADQTPVTTVQGQWFDWLAGGVDIPSWVTPIDMRPVYEDASMPGRWKTPGKTGSLLSSVAVNALSCSIGMSAVVEPGESLVIDNERIFVSATSGAAGGQTVLTHSRFTTVHANAAAVKTAWTSDGVHPGAPLTIVGGDYLAGLKASGVIL